MKLSVAFIDFTRPRFSSLDLPEQQKLIVSMDLAYKFLVRETCSKNQLDFELGCWATLPTRIEYNFNKASTPQIRLKYCTLLVKFVKDCWVACLIRSSCSELFLKISQKLQENTCARVKSLRPATLFKKKRL